MSLESLQLPKRKTIFQVLRLAGAAFFAWAGHYAAVQANLAPQDSALEFYWSLWMLASIVVSLGLLAWFGLAAWEKDLE